MRTGQVRPIAHLVKIKGLHHLSLRALAVAPVTPRRWCQVAGRARRAHNCERRVRNAKATLGQVGVPQRLNGPDELTRHLRYGGHSAHERS
eukprot:2504965-Prymnesium_polylepis.1